MSSKRWGIVLSLLLWSTPVWAAQVVATWQPQGVATAYRVERTVNNGAWQAQATLAAPMTVYSQTGLAVNTEYCYRVIAINNNMEGVPSDKACALLREPFGVITVYIP